MLRTINAVSSLLLGIGLLLMGLALLGTSLGVRAVQEHFSDTTTGMVMACYFAGFIIGSYLCPSMIRRYGPIRSYAALAAIGASSTFMHALIIDPVVWAILRCIMGVCLVGLYMVIESWLNAISTNDKRARIFSVYMIVTLGAHALGQFLLLLDPEASVAAFGIAAVFFSLGLVPVALTRLPQPEPLPTPSLPVSKLFAHAPLSLGGALTGGLVTSSFWGMGAVFAQRVGLSGDEIVTFMVTTIVGGVLLQWPVGRLSDSFDRRKVLVVVGALAAMAALFAAMMHDHSVTWLYVCMFLIGGLSLPIYALSVACLNDSIHSSEALEASRGMLLIFGIGAFLGPLFAGLTMTLLGPGGLFYYMTVVLCLFILFDLVIIRHSPPVPEEERSTFIPMTRTSPAALELDPRLEHPDQDAENMPPEDPGPPIEEGKDPQQTKDIG